MSQAAQFEEVTEATEAVEVKNDLVVMKFDNPLEVFKAPNGLDPYLDVLRKKLDDFKPDMAKAKGRDEVRSMAAKVAKLKVALDNMGKELTEEQKSTIDAVNLSRRNMRDTLDKWRDEVRQPLTDYENKEAERIEAHKTALAAIKALAVIQPDMSSTEIQSRIDELSKVEPDDSWQEFELDAIRAKRAAGEALLEALDARKAHEEQLAEIERFKAEQAERERIENEQRIAREAEERARAEAEAKANAEREAAAAREAAAIAENERLKREAEQAETRRIEAERKAESERLSAEQRAKDAAEQARQAEVQRQADEKAAAEREARAREEDKANKAKVYGAMKEALMLTGMSEEHAKAAVKLIATGQVPHVSIIY
jgi:hypothetical protein